MAPLEHGTPLFSVPDVKYPMAISVGVRSVLACLVVVGHMVELYGEIGLMGVLVIVEVGLAFVLKAALLKHAVKVDGERRVSSCPVKEHCQLLISADQKVEALKKQIQDEQEVVTAAIEKSSAKEVRRLLLEIQNNREVRHSA